MWREGLLHFLVNKFQPSFHSHDGFATVLLQEDGADEFVDLGGGWEEGEFFLNAFVLLLLGFELLAGCYRCLEIYPIAVGVSMFWGGGGGGWVWLACRFGAFGRRQ